MNKRKIAGAIGITIITIGIAIPTDNSAGNFVKIQQRIPVRIDFVNISKEANDRLAAGMMCEVKLK